MTLQLSTAVRNASLDAIEATIGTGAILTIRTGLQPATCATANSGTVLVTATLPTDWMAGASGGAKTLSGTWQDTSADASGRGGHFRVHDSTGTTCGMQGVAAGPWFPSRAYVLNDVVTNDTGKVFKVTTAGTSAASGGPTGTGTGITDGTVTWAFLQAAADLALDGSDFTAGQAFNVSAFTLTAGNA